MRRISTFARIRLVWASTMLVVVPLSPGRFGSHRWIEPIWESCLVIYVSVMLFQIRRGLREPAEADGAVDDLLVEPIPLPALDGGLGPPASASAERSVR